jgi:putative chitinase
MTEQKATNVADPPLTLDERKLQLEREKFEFEQQKVEDKGFFNNKFGLAITAIVSVATVVVSVIQLLISERESAAKIRLDRDKNGHEIEKDRQQFQFDIARLLLEKASDIKTSDPRSVIYIRNVVIATLPLEVAKDISGRMAENSDDPDVKQIWLQGSAAVQSQADAPTLQRLWAGISALGSDKSVVPSPSASNALSISSGYILSRFPKTRGHEDQLKALLTAAHDQNIDTSLRLAAFLACVFANSDPSLSQMVENLNYSPSRLLLVFPFAFSTPKDAENVAHNPELIANVVYANRMGNGPPETGDGWRYRGRGYLQITGREAYAEASSAMGIDLVSDPDKLLDPSIAARQAAVYFAQSGLLPYADNGDIVGLWRRINGGLAGFENVRT